MAGKDVFGWYDRYCHRGLLGCVDSIDSHEKLARRIPNSCRGIHRWAHIYWCDLVDPLAHLQTASGTREGENMNDENILLEKEIEGISYRLFAKRQTITISFTDGTSIKTSRWKLIKAFRAKKVSEHNTQMIGIAFSPIP